MNSINTGSNTISSKGWMIELHCFLALSHANFYLTNLENLPNGANICDFMNDPTLVWLFAMDKGIHAGFKLWDFVSVCCIFIYHMMSGATVNFTGPFGIFWWLIELVNNICSFNKYKWEF